MPACGLVSILVVAPSLYLECVVSNLVETAFLCSVFRNYLNWSPSVKINSFLGADCVFVFKGGKFLKKLWCCKSRLHLTKG